MKNTKKGVINKVSITLNVILILLIIIYVFVPFLSNGFLTKMFSPFCGIKTLYQGEDYAPAWCQMLADENKPEADDSDFSLKNLNTSNPPTNENINSEPVNVNSELNTNTAPETGLANPASTKCVADGGTIEMYDSAEGQFGICVFKDKSICDEWAYFRGECKPGQCLKACQAVGTKSEGWYNSCTKTLLKYDNCAPQTTEPEKPVTTTQSNIKLTSPLPDVQLTSPIVVAGEAIVYQDKIYARVKSKGGTTLIEVDGTAKHTSGTEWGAFSLKINYEFSTTKEGFVEVYWKDQDGKERDLISVPVKF